MPIYTLNLFDIIPGKEAIYRQYSRRAGIIIEALGGMVLSSGWKPKTLHGEDVRNCLIVVEFPDEESFNDFLYNPENAEIHLLRETSTENYIWKLFQPWDLKKWVAFPSYK